MIGRVKNCIMLDRIVIAPTARSPPYFCRDILKQMFNRLSVLCIINGDTPRATTGRRMSLRIRMYFLRICKMLRWDVRNLSTHKHEMAWERMVAQAAPATPILKTKMNIGSRIILITAPIMTVIILVFAKPWAEIKLFSPMVTVTKKGSQNINRHIIPAIANGIFAGAKKHEQRLAEEFKNNDQQNGKDDGQGKTVAKDLFRSVIVLLAHADGGSGSAAVSHKGGKR